MLQTELSDILRRYTLTKTPLAKKSSAKDDDTSTALSKRILEVLDENSAQDTLTIDIRGKSSVADYMIVSSGRSNRHVSALSDYVLRALKEDGHKSIGVEGLEASDWVLIDAGDVILHIFRPEVRAFYNLEKIWSVPLPESLRAHVQDEEFSVSDSGYEDDPE